MRAFAFLLICSGLATTPVIAADATLPAGAVATVNGQPVSRAMLDELARSRAASGLPPEMQDRRRMLDDLVDMELLAQRAKATGVAARPQTRAELELAHKTLLGQRLMQQLIAEMPVDEAELQARYRTLPLDVQIDASHILVKEEKLARDLIAQLERGASFAALARKHTLDTETAARGGALNPVLVSELAPAFAAAAQALKPGQYTREPVQTEFGWHVIRLTALHTQPKPTYERLKDELRKLIAGERLQAQLAQWRKEAKLTVLQAP
ncbi:peptidylprolyl isomerase [Rhizobacter sp. J219]|jgi:peptidyl-prolyl cis-trans isomerase C|uniref:peptidylprolyl isomerase n=1 Tax=Rhizobacter sp. J219 TaxID=2898430 RepID=UPI00215175F8|nr:peptidylprolyl isomerase [Rhizobacter sp. J219]MCR5883593.1 peptidylprolyl isomerase [Rhizobacter sp. J219]